jgi:DNA-binding Lrp family transcriptional regulator
MVAISIIGETPHNALPNMPIWNDAKASTLRWLVRGTARLLASRCVASTDKRLNPSNRAWAPTPKYMECYRMTGTSDLLMHVVVGHLQSYERFADKLTRIPIISNIQTRSFPLKPVVYKTELPLEEGIKPSPSE